MTSQNLSASMRIATCAFPLPTSPGKSKSVTVMPAVNCPVTST